MSLTLKDLGLRFKRYDIVHPSGPNFRAIMVTEENLHNIFRYIEASGHDQSVEFNPVKNVMYIFQLRTYKVGLGGSRRKRTRLTVRAGDWIVQYHNSIWERLTNEEFQKILKPVELGPDFKRVNYGTEELFVTEITADNGQSIVDFVNANAGRATLSARVPGDIRLFQRTSGKGWSKRDWRVGEPGDYVAHQSNGEFFRVKRADINNLKFV